jgi:hypothetical protein
MIAIQSWSVAACTSIPIQICTVCTNVTLLLGRGDQIFAPPKALEEEDIGQLSRHGNAHNGHSLVKLFSCACSVCMGL